MTVAREVVDDYECMDDWNKPRTRSGKEVPPSRVTLARAVIRMDELADRLDPKNDWAPEWCREAAAEIRAALEGETHA